MSKFVLEIIDEVCGKQKFYKLFISGKCEFDIFWDKYSRDKLMRKQLAIIQTRLKAVADLNYNCLDKTKFRELKRDRADLHKDYEIKTKNLRLYFFKDDKNGQVIVIGGNKDSQDEDLIRMRAIKKEYFKTKKNV